MEDRQRLAMIALRDNVRDRAEHYNVNPTQDNMMSWKTASEMCALYMDFLGLTHDEMAVL